MEYKLTIKGNPKDPTGNPIPYKRSTQRTQWKPEIRLYNLWKDYVRNELFKKYPDTQYVAGGKYKLAVKPFDSSTTQKVRVDIMIYFKDHTFGDPDNIFKGIADALLKCDKYVAGSFDFAQSPDGKGRVEVKLTVYPQLVNNI